MGRSDGGGAGLGAAVGLVVALLAGACAGPGDGLPARGTDVPWSPRAVARQLDTDYNTAGLQRVQEGVEACYARAVGVGRESLRGCLVLDYTAWRIDSRVRGPALGHSAYWRREAVNERWARHAVPAGFGEADEILAFMRRGSDEAVAFMVLVGLPISWQAGFGPRPVRRIRPGTF